MSHQWNRTLHACMNYRWSLDPAPTDTAWDATVNRRRNRMLGNLSICGGLLLGTRIAWMVWG